MVSKSVKVNLMILICLFILLPSCSGGGGGGGGTGSGGPGGGNPGGGSTNQPSSTVWATRKSAGSVYPINAVARSSGGKFVAAVDNGTVLTSADGYSWTGPTSTGLFTFNDVVWGNNQFVAVGHFGFISTSPDGITWTKRSECGLGCTDELTSLAWSGSRYVAAGEGGMIYTSTDGTLWSAATTTFSNPSLTTFRSVATNGSLFTAVSYDYNALKGMIVYSSDGMIWSRATITPETGYEFDRVIWDGSRFLATAWGSPAGVWTSSSGTDWTQLTTNLVSKITSTGSGYIGTSGVGGMMVSSDAVNWTTTYNFVSSSIYDILWMSDRNEYLAAGGLPATRGLIATSTDASTWNVRYSSDDFASVLWDGTTFVAMDETGRLFTSSDGLTWDSNRSIPANDSGLFFDIAWNGSRYVAVKYGRISSSTDSITWGDPYYWSLGNFVSVIWTGSEFAAITTAGEFFRSPDGIAWPAPADVFSIGTNLTDIAWSGTNGYAAVALGGNIYTSPTGTPWTSHAAAAPGNLRAVASNGTQFVAVGDSGTIVTSADGNTWTNHSLSGGPSLTDVAWTGSQFIAVSSNGKVFVSTDGASWSSETTDTTAVLVKAASSPTRAVAVGALGSIVSR